MNTLIFAVTLAAMFWSAWNLVTILRRRRERQANEAAQAAGSTAGMAADRLLDDARLSALPFYIRAGHSFLVFTDFAADRLEIDGVDVGNPDRLDADGERTFYGYFNVTPGQHQLVAYSGNKVARFTLDMAPNRAYVKRLDWARSIWVDVDLATQARFRNLVWSGLLLEAKALQPWPLASLYFVDAPEPLFVNGKLAPAADFFGLTDLPPGEIVLSNGKASTSWNFPPKCMHVVTFANGEPQLLDPRASAVLVGRMLRSASLSALVSHAQMSEATMASMEPVVEPASVEKVEVAAEVEVEIELEPALVAKVEPEPVAINAEAEPVEMRRYTIVRSATERPQEESTEAARDHQTASSPIPDQITPFRGYGLGMMAPA